MIEYSDGSGARLEQLKWLWKKAFGDEDDFIDTFFQTGYAPECCRVAIQDGALAGMLFWFDCSLGANKIAYIYGVATDPAAQGQGVASGLLEDVHRLLKDCGYSGAILVPASDMLFMFYEKRGYSTVSCVSEGVTHAAKRTSVEEIDVDAYEKLRREYLPVNGIKQVGRNMVYLDKLACFYRGSGFVAAVSKEDRSRCTEFLGDPDQLPGLAGALGCGTLRYRMPGPDKAFAMGIRFDGAAWTDGVYFGLAFD